MSQTADDLEKRLAEPKSATNDGQTVQQDSIPDTIKGLQYAAALRRTQSLRISVITSPGATGRIR